MDEFARIRYLTEGEVVLPTDDVERILTHLVTSVLDRLVEQKETGTPLEKEWEALNGLGSDEREYCIAAAKLGLDPFAEADQYEASIIEAAHRLPHDVLGDFFHAVDPRHIKQAVDWITDATSEADALAGDPSEEIRSVRTALASSSTLDNDAPWRRGWRQAQVTRQALGLRDDSRLDIEQYVPTRSRSGVDPHLQAVGIAPGDFVRPAIALGRTAGPSGTRFIQGRALWHRLTKDESTFLITTSYTDLQKVERAFAAELLAPAEGIRTKLSVPPGEAVQEDLGSVAEHFGVSPILIENQIENQILSGRH
ncbi:MAG: ImmA/IrrE family metallo-endopeptidase [Pseudonocardiaceae bacterium]